MNEKIAYPQKSDSEEALENVGMKKWLMKKYISMCDNQLVIQSYECDSLIAHFHNLVPSQNMSDRFWYFKSTSKLAYEIVW